MLRGRRDRNSTSTTTVASGRPLPLHTISEVDGSSLDVSGSNGNGNGNGKIIIADKSLPTAIRRRRPRAATIWNCYNCWRQYCGNAAAVVPGVTFASALLTLQTTTSTFTTVRYTFVVTLASLLTMGLGILLVLQYRKLKDVGTLRAHNNELRKRVYYMRQERERLHRSLDRVDITLAELQKIPQELHKFSRNKNVDRIVEIVQEQKNIQTVIKEKMNQQILQQIMQVVVRSDRRDGNWTLRPTEVEALIVRIGLVEGVEFHEQRFRDLVQAKQPTVATIMGIIRSLLEGENDYEHPPPIFVIKEIKI
jgi:hypothetical protein